MPLSPTDRRALALERTWALICPDIASKPASAPEEYRREMRELIDRPEAEAHAPVTVRWLRRNARANDEAEGREADGYRWAGLAAMVVGSGVGAMVACDWAGVLARLSLPPVA